MKRGVTYKKTQFNVPITRTGESLEEMLRRMRNSKEPIQANAKINYTERKDGVLPQYDIRSDRFEYAMNAANRVHATKYAQRMNEDGYKQDENGKWKPMSSEELAAQHQAGGGGEA